MSTLSPGQLPLAPLGAGDLIDRAVRLYRRHLFVLIRTAAPPVIIIAAGWILASLSLRQFFKTSETSSLLVYGGLTALAVVIMLAGYLSILVVMGGATRTLVAHLLRNDPVTAQATYKAVRSRFWGLTGASIIVLVWIFASFLAASSGGQMVGFLFFIAAGAMANLSLLLAGIIGVIGMLIGIAFTLWLFFFIVGRVAYVPQVMLVEGKGVIDSIGRSISLARGNVRRLTAMTLFTSFATLSALMILSFAIFFFGRLAGIDPAAPAEWPAWFTIAGSILGPLSAILLTPVWMLGLSLLYVDERVRHEGYDIELMASRQLGEVPDINVSSPLGTALYSERKKPPPPAARLFMLIVVLFLFPVCASAIPISEYQQNLKNAIAALDTLDENEDESESDYQKRFEQTVEGIRTSLPKTQTVEADGESCTVDNAWLHRALHELKSDDFEKLNQILESLQAVEARVEERQATARSTDSKEWAKGRLEAILARPEYVSQSRGPNALQRLLQDFFRWLQKFLPKRTNTNPSSAKWINLIARIGVVLAGLLLVGFIATLLLKRFKREAKIKVRKKKEARIVLGERLEPEQTAVDLLSEAEELARRGELRAAIRKAYIALLVELGDRKIISLAQHKTNRDYLNALRSAPELHSKMRGLTNSFERHWYGFVDASENDWQEFRSKYLAARQSGTN
ncbi:MAG TPA: DUF4129 domain-containing protein [Pyrinomonadaceae bacterium]|nr:DUF4129 domain-containing protein [Pyrinomonadaceae bacterium]